MFLCIQRHHELDSVQTLQGNVYNLFITNKQLYPEPTQISNVQYIPAFCEVMHLLPNHVVI